MKKIFFLGFLFISTQVFSLNIEPSNNIQLYGHLTFAVPLGEFNEKYSFPMGINVEAKELFELKINRNHKLYPGIELGWFYMKHREEDQRRLQLFPLFTNIFWDTMYLKFPSKFLAFSPYGGIGVFFANYKSVRTGKTAMNFSYKLGILTSFVPPILTATVIELSIEHFLIYEKSASMVAFDFSIGARYNFSLKKKYISKKEIKNSIQIGKKNDSNKNSNKEKELK